MTARPEFPQQAEAYVHGLAFDAIRRVLRHDAATRNLAVHVDSEAEITVQLMRGLLSVWPNEQGVLARVRASRSEWLQVLKEGLAERLAQFSPEVVEGLRWSGQDQIGERPSNFHFARVQSVTPIGSAFLRVRASSPDLSGFQDDAIHFRLVLPPKGTAPVQWPTLAANGTTIWPKGDHALHRPVYTVRSIDRSASTLDIDIFLHEGGRVTEWASSARPGVEFGISGPVGAGIPQANRLLAYADETAFPALARILESASPDTVGHVTLLVDEGVDCGYPITAPNGVSVTWQRRGAGADLAALALAGHLERPDHYLWVAAEKSDVLRVRAGFKDSDGDPKQSYLSAYWSRP